MRIESRANTENELIESSANQPEVEADFAQSIQNQAEAELAALINDREALEKSIDPNTEEGQEALITLETLKEAEAQVTATFWQRFKEIVGSPVESYRKAKQESRERELSTPDNQKIIKELFAGLEAIHKKIISDQEKFRKKQTTSSSSTQFTYENKTFTHLSELITTYEVAVKEKPENWEKVEQELSEVLQAKIYDVLRKKDYDQALELFSHHPRKKDNYNLYQLAKTIIFDIVAEKFEPAWDENSSESETKENALEKFLNEEFKDFPDLQVLGVTLYFDRKPETPAKLVNALTKTKDQVFWVANRFQLESEIPLALADANLIKQLFNAYRANNNKEILRHTEVFKEHLEALSKDEREKLISDLVKSPNFNRDLAANLMASLVLTSAEFTRIENSLLIRYKDGARQELKAACKTKKPVGLIKNYQNLELSPAELESEIIEALHHSQSNYATNDAEILKLITELQINPPAILADKLPQLKTEAESFILSLVKKHSTAYSSSEYILKILAELETQGIIDDEILSESVKIILNSNSIPVVSALFEKYSHLIPDSQKDSILSNWVMWLHPQVAQQVFLKFCFRPNTFIPVEKFGDQLLNLIAQNSVLELEDFFTSLKNQGVENTEASRFLEKISKVIPGNKLAELTSDQHHPYINSLLNPESNKRLELHSALTGYADGLLFFIEKYDLQTDSSFTKQDLESIRLEFIQCIGVDNYTQFIENPKKYFFVESLGEVVNLLIESDRLDILDCWLENQSNTLNPDTRNKIRLVIFKQNYNLRGMIKQLSEQSNNNSEEIDGFLDEIIQQPGRILMVLQAGKENLSKFLKPEQITAIVDLVIESGSDEDTKNLFELQFKKNNLLSEIQFYNLYKKIIKNNLVNVSALVTSNWSKMPPDLFDSAVNFVIELQKQPPGHQSQETYLLQLLECKDGHFVNQSSLGPERRAQATEKILNTGSVTQKLALYQTYIKGLSEKTVYCNLSQKQSDQIFEEIINFKDGMLCAQILILAKQAKELPNAQFLNPDQEKKMVNIILQSGQNLENAISYDSQLFTQELAKRLLELNNIVEQTHLILNVLPWSESLNLEVLDQNLLATVYEHIIIKYNQTPLAQLELMSTKTNTLFSKTVENLQKKASPSELVQLGLVLLKLGRSELLPSKQFIAAVDAGSEKPREKQISISLFIGQIGTSGRYNELRELMPADQEETECLEQTNYVKKFLEKYQTGNKGKTIFTLLATREAMASGNYERVLPEIIRKMKEYEKILDRYDSNSIPPGIKASIGMEYEITKSTANGYKEKYQGDFKKDITTLSTAADIGAGWDAVHEIATKPTDNPYAMLLEMKLIQDLGFVDFNFTEEDYKNGAHGIHLTLGGESGITPTQSTNLLHNSLLVSGWGGMNAGRMIDYSSRARGSVRGRGEYGSIKVFADQTPATELRCFSIDKWEPFERTILTAHNGAIAIQATEKLLNLPENFYTEILPTNTGDIIEVYKQYQREDNYLVDQKTVAIACAWLEYARSVMQSITDHNENFIDNETAGYITDSGEYVDPDEWGGAENESRFKSVISSLAPNATVDEYAAQTTFKNRLFVEPTTNDLINTAAKINNLFLKPSTKSGGDQVNALASLEVTKFGNGKLEDNKASALTDSIFDKKGKTRQGYYSIQGASEKMITHALQRHLLQFNGQMEQILKREEPLKEKSRATPVQLAA